MISSENIDQALARGSVIITGNARAARRLQFDYGLRQRALGHTAWPTPAILDWRTWLDNLWQEWTFRHPDAPTLLTPLQETALWKSAQGDDALTVVSPESMATLAQQAYALLCDYQAHSARRNPWTEPDAERFRQWAQAFDHACTSNHWLSSGHMAEQLAEAARAAELILPQEIHLTGFDRITPAQQSFLSALSESGVPVQIHEPGSPQAEIRSRLALSERSEIEACALWLRRQLEAQPSARLTVLCTDIEQRRAAIDRIFRRVLTPEIDSSPDAPSPRAVYEFTLGSPLSGVPVIHAALLALRWLAGPLSQQDLTLLLLSGYITSSEDERLACARTDAALREHTSLSPLITLERFLESRFHTAPLPEPLRQRLQSAFDFAAQNRFASESRLPGAWAELARLALEKLAWPGSRIADSVQFQAQHRWEKLLEDISRLDFNSSPMSCGDFLHNLTLHARQTLFSPESLDAPIQIMGPMESAGQTFDAIWFLNATDEQWPSTGRAHPLLPIHLQREAPMPHAERDDDWQIAQSVTARILASTPQITFSRAQRNHDGELRPSPIVTALTAPEFAIDTGTNIPNSPETLESWQDSAPVPYSGSLATGGATLLRNQAACPFRAFATHRLHASEVAESEWGLSALDRGTLLHDILCRFWSSEEPRRVASRDDLLRTIAEGALQPLLEHHIDASFAEKLPQNLHDSWLLAYLDAEKRRLAELLTAWLTTESKRQPFTVEYCEQRLPNVTVGPLQLNLQADRIDRLPGGSRLLIDYKTGKMSAASWQGDRPDEPQLPLYAVYGNVENVSGLLFAQIRPHDTKCIGHLRDARAQLFADLSDKSPLVRQPYEDAMHDAWQSALANLAEEFARGEARVAPKHGETTCQYCLLPNLCRIHELNAHSEHSLWENAEDSDETGEDDHA